MCAQLALSAELGATPEQASLYAVPKTIVELQQFRSTQVLPVTGPAGLRGTATLINLNPLINRWYLLQLDWANGKRYSYHLENANHHTLALTQDFHPGLMLGSAEQHDTCDLGSALKNAAASPYAPLCNGRLYLHNAVHGHQSNLEAMVEFLRDRGGEKLLDLAKQTLFLDAWREPAAYDGSANMLLQAAFMPTVARLNPAMAHRKIGRGSLGIASDLEAQFAVGQWTSVKAVKGAYLSLMAPEAIAPEILNSHLDRANVLGSKESTALVYLIAFDMQQFELGFGMGTDHPRVDWSPRPALQHGTLPGPDGIGSVKPLITTGMIPPMVAASTVATFTGGFKRYHGAFRYGDFASKNHGSHYGFIQEGVVLSKLQPGLSTLYVLRDGSVHMQVWNDADSIAELRYARQNGVPLVEWDKGEPIPGALVRHWGPGNWSGSEQGDLSTVRAGICLQQTPQTEYLIYAYFSNATPSAMARVFQAYGCLHAMQLDINAPILTYLAIYSSAEPAVQYLVQTMSQADQKLQGRTIPRFLALPDNRDFFYLYRRAVR